MWASETMKPGDRGRVPWGDKWPLKMQMFYISEFRTSSPLFLGGPLPTNLQPDQGGHTHPQPTTTDQGVAVRLGAPKKQPNFQSHQQTPFRGGQWSRGGGLKLVLLIFAKI